MTVEAPLPVAQFRHIISLLPEDPPRPSPRCWYLTQKQHWLGWLGDYDSPGGYERKGGPNRDAKFAYNHVVNPYMLIYLIKALNLPPATIAAAEAACQAGNTLMEKAGLIRKQAPWAVIYPVLCAFEAGHTQSDPEGPFSGWWRRLAPLSRHRERGRG